MPELLDLNETETRETYIDPVLTEKGWIGLDNMRREVKIRAGRILNDFGRRAAPDSADYVLYKGSYAANEPIAVIEAKRARAVLGTGREQAIDYARRLDARFAYTTNGSGFTEIDLETNAERTFSMEEFPTPDELWNMVQSGKTITENEMRVIEQPLAVIDGKEPRSYQTLAINRVVKAIASGQKRALLVLATGTGKTYIASQIVWKLMKTRLANKILYLADRNVLIGQTVTGDFKPFANVATTIRKTSDPSKMKAYKLFFALYQGLTEKKKDGALVDPLAYIKKIFPADYFDLIIVDECHRGSARKDSQWRSILEYFSSAAQIGMTATPRETTKISNIDYFGKPLLLYKLNDGIDDGYLAPYVNIRVNINRDLEGYRPEAGTLDEDGNEVPDRVYTPKDFDRNIVIDERTKVVAKRIAEYMIQNDPMAKTIVFCVDIEHAERMARALRERPEFAPFIERSPYYITRCTSGPGGEGRHANIMVERFCDPSDPYPVICTTSDLMTTGVDAKTCRLIVLDCIFGENGMTKFKQIIGRGTRIREDYQKYRFTILDFRDASRLFADPDFNGDPDSIIIIDGDDPLPKPKPTKGEGDDPGPIVDPVPPSVRKKIKVQGVDVTILSERVQYLDADGRLITESYVDYSKHRVLNHIASLNDFLTQWPDAEKRAAIRAELAREGVDLEQLRKDVGIEGIDDFDLLCHVVFDQKPLTRSERARHVKQKEYFEKYSEKAKAVLEILLDKYADGAIDDLSDMEILKLPEIQKIGSPLQIVREFNGRDGWLAAMQMLSNRLYERI